MKLYYSRGACSLAVRIVIHEIGIACAFESVDLKTKQTETNADYFKINLKGAVPALVLDEGAVLTENVVIQQYLADTYKAETLLPPAGHFNRYRVLEWLNFVSTDLHKSCSPLFNPKVPQEIKDTIFKEVLKKNLQFTDKHLEKNSYLTGDDFTLPDSYLFVVLRWLPSFGIAHADYPNLARFFNEVKERPAVAKALQEEGLS
jgi:glutathione S-transferase